MSSKPAPWQDRIVGFERVPPDQLNPNPNNWRRHPEAQRKALAGLLGDVGWVGTVLANRTTGNILDGHARQEEAVRRKEPLVPVTWVEISEEDERKVLATFDPIGALAQTDEAMLAELLEGITTDNVDLATFLAGLMPDAGAGVQLGAPGSKTDTFGVPPFSVLDARQGYWQDRKRAWIRLGIDSGEGRPDDLLLAPEGASLITQRIRKVGAGTSIFDPVLAELAVRWFCPPGGAVLDPFAGGSVRGIVAALCGRPYTGIDVRREQVVANRLQWHGLASAAQLALAAPPEPADNLPDLTPVERHGDIWLKRDDLFAIAGVRGGKVRTCWALAQGAAGLITAGSRASPQVNIVAHIAKAIGIPCRAHVPSGQLSQELHSAKAAGAEIIQHKPGYNSVIVARAREDATETGWTEIPFGMECEEAVRQTQRQVANIPLEATRLVVSVGSGMTLAGILWGLHHEVNLIPVLGVVVGADPSKRLDQYAPPNWRDRATLVNSGTDYHRPDPTPELDGVALDPHYEAKAARFLKPGDCLWCVGIRATVETQNDAPEPDVEPVAPTDPPPTNTEPPADITTGFLPVTPADEPTLLAYYATLPARRSAPRYWLSPSYLATQGNTYLWAEHNGCLVLLRRRITMGNMVLYLVHPPISRTGDAAAELALLRAYQTIGVAAVLSEQDVAEYRLAGEVTPDPNGDEFVFSADAAREAAGAKYKNIRAAMNQAERMQGIDIVVTRSLDSRTAKALDALDTKWREQTGNGAASGKAVAAFSRFAQANDEGRTAVIMYATEPRRPVAFALVETVAPGWATHIAKARDRDFTDHPDPELVVDIAAWRAQPPGTLITLGSSVGDKGMDVAKSKRQPVATVPLFRLAATPLDRETYNRLAPGKRQKPAPQPTPKQAATTTAQGAAPAWIHADSRALDTLLPAGQQFDLVFSCPPYADLEVYSDDPADISTMDYAGFMAAYREIIAKAVARLQDNRFAFWVVGEVRDGRGLMRGFGRDTIAAFEDAGARLYNEAVLVTAAGSLPLRAGRMFRAARKLGKGHQNVLVFLKGDHPEPMPIPHVADACAAEFEHRRTMIQSHEAVLIFAKGDPAEATKACGQIDMVLPEDPDPQ